VRENEKEKREKQREKKTKKKEKERRGETSRKIQKNFGTPLPCSLLPSSLFFLFISLFFALSFFIFCSHQRERKKRLCGTKTSLFLLIKCWRT